MINAAIVVLKLFEDARSYDLRRIPLYVFVIADFVVAMDCFLSSMSHIACTSL